MQKGWRDTRHLFFRNFGQLCEKGFAHANTPCLGHDEKILELASFSRRWPYGIAR